MVDEKTIQTIKNIIRSQISSTRYKTFIFGSRSSLVYRSFSDIDIGIEGPKPLSAKQFIQIKDDLENSDIPYRVDIVDFSTVTEKFRNNSMQRVQYI